MSRRVRTLLIGGVLFLILFVLALTLPVPYVILSPGPTINTLGTDSDGTQVIGLKGRTAKPTNGHLNLTTVLVSTDSVSVFQVLRGWLLHDEVVVPRAAEFPPGQSEKKVDEQNTQDLLDSQDSATEAALCELGYPSGFGLRDIAATAPAAKVLKPGDLLVSLNGTSIDTFDKLSAVLQTQRPGTTVQLIVKRQGALVTEPVQLIKPVAGRKGASIGVTVADGCLAPFVVDLGLANQIGGPSAGLMFALGIIDKVGAQDLTNGAFIAGTGTIDGTGKVGPIGGIQLKMIAARHAGAKVFLAPAANCADVRADTPDGLNVVKVATLHEAVQDLLTLQHGGTVPHC